MTGLTCQTVLLTGNTRGVLQVPPLMRSQMRRASSRSVSPRHYSIEDSTVPSFEFWNIHERERHCDDSSCRRWKPIEKLTKENQENCGERQNFRREKNLWSKSQGNIHLGHKHTIHTCTRIYIVDLVAQISRRHLSLFITSSTRVCGANCKWKIPSILVSWYVQRRLGRSAVTCTCNTSDSVE